MREEKRREGVIVGGRDLRLEEKWRGVWVAVITGAEEDQNEH